MKALENDTFKFKCPHCGHESMLSKRRVITKARQMGMSTMHGRCPKCTNNVFARPQTMKEEIEEILEGCYDEDYVFNGEYEEVEQSFDIYEAAKKIVEYIKNRESASSAVQE
jgi:predicted RNA-binding Zn-ribbon protein involved in translation (DUF1610 family)